MKSCVPSSSMNLTATVSTNSSLASMQCKPSQKADISQRSCSAKKAAQPKTQNFDKTLMADLSRQARQPMIVTSVDAAYCYDHVSHIIMSLDWLVLTNGNFPAIVVAMISLQTRKFFQRTGFGKSKAFFGGLLSSG